MDSIEINKYLRNSDVFGGVYPRNKLPHPTQKPVTYIVNTDKDGEPGEHWIAIHLNKDGSGEFFDSYGLPPLFDDFLIYLNNNCPLGWGYNTHTLQCISCITCGHYCVLYVKFKDKHLTFCQFISIFTYDKEKNDKIVKKYLKIK